VVVDIESVLLAPYQATRTEPTGLAVTCPCDITCP